MKYYFQQASEFCQIIGLHVTKERVQLQRSLDVTPIEPLILLHEDDIVLSKNEKRFAEVGMVKYLITCLSCDILLIGCLWNYLTSSS